MFCNEENKAAALIIIAKLFRTFSDRLERAVKEIKLSIILKG